MRARIAVIGLDGPLSLEVAKMAETVGVGIARAGCILICGGRGGIMEAAARGAKDAGGTTVGILPSFDKAEANPYIDIAITTGMGYTRNSLVVGSADAVIALAGSTGTLSEMAMALNFKKPVIAVKGSGGTADAIGEAFPGNELIASIIKAEADEAVDAALEAAGITPQ